MKKDDVTLHPADQLGLVRSQIADLRSQEKDLEKKLIKLGVGRQAGVFYDATVVAGYSRDNTSWKSVAMKLNPSHQLIAAHTSPGWIEPSVQLHAKSKVA